MLLPSHPLIPPWLALGKVPLRPEGSQWSQQNKAATVILFQFMLSIELVVAEACAYKSLVTFFFSLSYTIW